MSMRRYLIIGAIVIVLLGVGAVAYLYFANRSPSVAVAPAGNTTLPIVGQETPATTNSASPSPTTSSPTSVSARLVKITAGPVVTGEVVVDQKAVSASSSPETIVNYIERQSGNIFSYQTQSQVLTRISNKTLPGIQSASWLPDGSVAFVRYLSGADFSTTNTYALPANGSGGYFLAQNLSDLAVGSANILALASGVNGSVASLENKDGTHPTTVFTTPLSSVRVSFAGKGQYLLYTKPSGNLGGGAYLVDSLGHFSRVAGPLLGLTALPSPSGKWVLVSSVSGGMMQMELVNTATNEGIPLPIATIADKCVWASDESALYCGIPTNPPVGATYPDDWYQGAVSFSDRIWKVNVSGRYAQLVLDFSKETNGSLDAKGLAIDASGTTLVFVNKNDGSLWSYSL